MIPKEKRLGDIAEIIAGATGFDTEGTYAYRVVLPNSFSDTGFMNDVPVQYRNDEISILKERIKVKCGSSNISNIKDIREKKVVKSIK